MTILLVLLRPKSLEFKIEKFAFRECNNISQIELPESVKELGEGAFIGCCELQKINFPKNLEIIGAEYFSNSKMTMNKKQQHLLIKF